jgi:hypothetical protein
MIMTTLKEVKKKKNCYLILWLLEILTHILENFW